MNIKNIVKKTPFYRYIFAIHVLRLRMALYLILKWQKFVVYIKHKTPHALLMHISDDYKEYQSYKKYLLKKQSTINSKNIQESVSFIIPTRNAGDLFDTVLYRIRSQKNISNLEIIVIDSGSTDNTIKIAEKYDSIIMHQNPASFSHSKTRNKAILKSNGHYIVCTVQDALMLNEETVFDSICYLKATNASALSARHVPYHDCDAFAAWHVDSYMSMISPNNDNRCIHVNKDKFEKLPLHKKRRLCVLDDTYAVYERTILNKLGFFNEELSFGEDLDIGKKLLLSGYDIGSLYTNGIVHSHTRSPVYVLKRFFTDTYYSYKILGVNSKRNDLNGVSSDISSIITSMLGLLKPTIIDLLNNNTSIKVLDSSYELPLYNYLVKLEDSISSEKKGLKNDALTGSLREEIYLNYRNTYSYYDNYFHGEYTKEQQILFWEKIIAMTFGTYLGLSTIKHAKTDSQSSQVITRSLMSEI